MISLGTVLAGAFALALGCYMIAHYIAVNAHKIKREQAEKQRVLEMGEITMEAAGQIYTDLKDPKTQADEVEKIAGIVCKVLKAGDVPLYKQFEVPTKSPVAAG